MTPLSREEMGEALEIATAHTVEAGPLSNRYPWEILRPEYKLARALLQRDEEATEWQRAAGTHNETIGVLADQKAALRARVKALEEALRENHRNSHGPGCTACALLLPPASPSETR